ncbi:unnamed protein product [Pseudo-nitzschia multistriata]|uniref:MORN repeat-containing protein n=1 Tax=Pseudo-nitzschia multistriata TaxID=183589 RepID=A0A448YW52_9STRA|nr:unnamed protein product [Pseudo-nitzschia multistriata]
MSTVALKGILSHNETKGEWSWSGRWVFGDCVPELDPEPTDPKSSTTTHQKTAPSSSQPFWYRWVGPVAPSGVAVPSLKHEHERQPEEGAETRPKPPPSRGNASGGPENARGPSGAEPERHASQHPDGAAASEPSLVAPFPETAGGGSEPNAEAAAATKAETATGTKGHQETTGNSSGNGTAGEQQQQQQQQQQQEQRKEQGPPATGLAGAAAEKAATTTNDALVARGQADERTAGSTPITAAAAAEGPSKSTKKTPDATPPEPPGASSSSSSPPTIPGAGDKARSESIHRSSPPAATEPPAKADADADADARQHQPPHGETRTEPPPQGEAPPPGGMLPPGTVTFATIMPGFLEASSLGTANANTESRSTQRTSPLQCPESGRWRGHFENAVAAPRKRSAGRNKAQKQKHKQKQQQQQQQQQQREVQKIDEDFCLFLNAAPCPQPGAFGTGGEGGADASADARTGEASVDLFAFPNTTKDHVPRIPGPATGTASTTEESQARQQEKQLQQETQQQQQQQPNPGPAIPLVQVRGCGENRFGTFEIVGYLDPNTMVMEIQRQYVAVDPAPASPPSSRRRRSLSHQQGQLSSSEGPRPHSTRRRNPTWKRASYQTEDDRRRKKARPGHSPSLSSSSSPQNGAPGPAGSPLASPGTAAGSPLRSSVPFSLEPAIPGGPGHPLPRSSLVSGSGPERAVLSSSSLSHPHSHSSAAGRKGGKSSTKSRLVLPTQSNVAASSQSQVSLLSGGGRGSKKRAAPEGLVRAKKRSPGKASSATGGPAPSSSAKNGSAYIHLPHVGDPKKARWRAAHFLYYQREDPDQQPPPSQPQSGSNNHNSNNSNSGNHPASRESGGGNGGKKQGGDGDEPHGGSRSKPRYVVYEGEMVDGKREGRGICLFSDGTLYEGEWKRNKEHGYGTLTTSDRTRTIYEGEWERGRMQGKGVYYYGSSDPQNPGPRYAGEFRENLRYGSGTYFLPDGSVYDGQWRDGVMNGHGLFTWPDQSLYDGAWKDGKRHGQGLLKKADGFLYDGQWVNNTMEGRGSAVYPNGQKYEGSFHKGRREGRGTIVFTNGAVYEGRFRDDAVDGQGTMKMARTIVVPREKGRSGGSENESPRSPATATSGGTGEKQDFMIPISFQSDMTRILTKTGFM